MGAGHPILAVLLYVTFLEIPFVRIRRAFTNGRFMAAAFGMNFLVVPAVVWGLTWFLPQEPALLIGVLMVLLTPCIDYVITFTELAGGDSEQVTAATPALMLPQLLLLPLYLWLFMGEQVAAAVEPGPFVEAFLLIIALPLALAWSTEVWAERSQAGARWQERASWLPVPMMGTTLLVVIASQLPRVYDSIAQVAAVVPVYVAFLVAMTLLGRLAAGFVGMDAREARALVFASVTRNSLVVLPLALALPAGYELAPAVVVTQTLVELTGMVILIRAVPAWLLPQSPKRISSANLFRQGVVWPKKGAFPAAGLPVEPPPEDASVDEVQDEVAPVIFGVTAAPKRLHPRSGSTATCIKSQRTRPNPRPFQSVTCDVARASAAPQKLPVGQVT